MSWHCLYCEESLECNGLLEIFDIRGGVPKRLTIHLNCFARSLDPFSNTHDLKQEILSWNAELDELSVKWEKNND